MMAEPITYIQFVELVEQHVIFPFSPFVPDFPSLTEAAEGNDWHTDSATDPWQWRLRIVAEGKAAYGKFFGSKACFVRTDAFPHAASLLSEGRTAAERYRDGLMSSEAFRVYKVLEEQGRVDSRELRKASGLDARADKKLYEKALVELQNQGLAVIAGSREADGANGWSSMCYERAEEWIGRTAGTGGLVSTQEASRQLGARLAEVCTEPAYRYFAKKLQLR